MESKSESESDGSSYFSDDTWSHVDPEVCTRECRSETQSQTLSEDSSNTTDGSYTSDTTDSDVSDDDLIYQMHREVESSMREYCSDSEIDYSHESESSELNWVLGLPMDWAGGAPRPP